MYSHSTPALKYDPLKQVVLELVKLGVDFAKLPGCGTYSPGLFAKFPSKKDLAGKMPPQVIPMVEVERVVRLDVKAEVKSSVSDSLFKL